MHSVLHLYIYVACGVLFNHVAATSLDQLNQDFIVIIMNCLAQHPISASDLEEMTNKQMPDNEAAKCLFSCAYKKTGMMDEEGKLSVDGVRALSKKYFADDSIKIKISDDFTNACLSVNNEPVNDGTKGCDRAALLFKCSVDKAPEFEFF